MFTLIKNYKNLFLMTVKNDFARLEGPAAGEEPKQDVVSKTSKEILEAMQADKKIDWEDLANLQELSDRLESESSEITDATKDALKGSLENMLENGFTVKNNGDYKVFSHIITMLWEKVNVVLPKTYWELLWEVIKNLWSDWVKEGISLVLTWGDIQVFWRNKWTDLAFSMTDEWYKKWAFDFLATDHSYNNNELEIDDYTMGSIDLADNKEAMKWVKLADLENSVNVIISWINKTTKLTNLKSSLKALNSIKDNIYLVKADDSSKVSLISQIEEVKKTVSKRISDWQSWETMIADVINYIIPAAQAAELQKPETVIAVEQKPKVKSASTVQSTQPAAQPTPQTTASIAASTAETENIQRWQEAIQEGLKKRKERLAAEEQQETKEEYWRQVELLANSSNWILKLDWDPKEATLDKITITNNDRFVQTYLLDYWFSWFYKLQKLFWNEPQEFSNLIKTSFEKYFNEQFDSFNDNASLTLLSKNIQKLDQNIQDLWIIDIASFQAKIVWKLEKLKIEVEKKANLEMYKADASNIPETITPEQRAIVDWIQEEKSFTEKVEEKLYWKTDKVTLEDGKVANVYVGNDNGRYWMELQVPGLFNDLWYNFEWKPNVEDEEEALKELTERYNNKNKTSEVVEMWEQIEGPEAIVEVWEVEKIETNDNSSEIADSKYNQVKNLSKDSEWTSIKMWSYETKDWKMEDILVEWGNNQEPYIELDNSVKWFFSKDIKIPLGSINTKGDLQNKYEEVLEKYNK